MQLREKPSKDSNEKPVNSKKKTEELKEKKKEEEEEGKIESVSNKKRGAGVFDEELLRIIATMIIYALVVSASFYSHVYADTIFQTLAIVVGLFRIFRPETSTGIAESIQFVRMSTRFRKLEFYVLMVYNNIDKWGFSSLNTIFFSVNCIYDITLLLVGASVLLQLPRQDLFRAVFRECWFVFAILRCLKNITNIFIVSSCVAEIFGTGSIVFFLLSGGRVIPTRVNGFIGAGVALQKLLTVHGLL